MHVLSVRRWSTREPPAGLYQIARRRAKSRQQMTAAAGAACPAPPKPPRRQERQGQTRRLAPALAWPIRATASTASPPVEIAAAPCARWPPRPRAPRPVRPARPFAPMVSRFPKGKKARTKRGSTSIGARDRPHASFLPSCPWPWQSSISLPLAFFSGLLLLLHHCICVGLLLGSLRLHSPVETAQ